MYFSEGIRYQFASFNPANIVMRQICLMKPLSPPIISIQAHSIKLSAQHARHPIAEWIIKTKQHCSNKSAAANQTNEKLRKVLPQTHGSLSLSFVKICNVC
jgi:hypothetical protein